MERDDPSYQLGSSTRSLAVSAFRARIGRSPNTLGAVGARPGFVALYQQGHPQRAST